MIGEEYALLKDLGEGTFGNVKLGKHLTSGQLVAVKILEKRRITEQADVERVIREIKILKSIKHPHIIKLYEIIETQARIFLIMEYACGGELFDYIVRKDRLSEKDACKFYQQIVSGIEFLHQKGIAHRDLKPENLLLDKRKHLKIVDFGLSNTYKGSETLKTACGSPCYAAPEMIAGKRYNGIEVDIWSSGVTLYAMLCGFLPFEDPDTAILYKKILRGDFELPDFLSNRSIKFLQALLCTDPRQRLTLREIKKHQWFTQFDKKENILEQKNENTHRIALSHDAPNQLYNTQVFVAQQNSSLAEAKDSPSKQQYFAQTNQTVSSSITGTSVVYSKGVTYHQKSISESNDKAAANTSKASSTNNQNNTSRPQNSARNKVSTVDKKQKGSTSKKKTESSTKKAATLSAILGSPRGGVPTVASFMGRQQKNENNSDRKTSAVSMKEKLRILKNPAKEVLTSQ